MARILQDVSTVEADQRDFEPIPPGTYLAKIIESDLVDSKSGNGQMLKLTFEIVDGPHAGRKIWDQPNIVHTNPTAQTIGQQRLKAICDAIGHTGNVEDSEELHEQPMLIRVAIEQKDANYAAKNVIKSVKAADNVAPPTKPSAAPGKAPAAAAARPQTRPWGGNRPAAAH